MSGKIASLLRNRGVASRARPFDPKATPDDILACFRLLLGRDPNPEEWTGHRARAGDDLRDVVASYLGSLEFTRRRLLDPDGARHLEMFELDGFRMLATAGDAAVGRHLRFDDYEPDVTAVFRRLLRPGMGVLDIGANIGYFTMLSASLVGAEGHVTAIEPNPGNVRLLEASRRVNGYAQVSVAQVAAGRELGLLSLHTAHSNGSTWRLEDDLNGLLGATTVACMPVDLLLPAGRRIDLVKLDVEGAEYNALLGCAGLLTRDRPTIVSEFSPALMPDISGIDGEGYLRWIVGHGYELSVIQPDGSLLLAGTRTAEVLSAYATRGTDHIDIVAAPI